MDKIDEWMNRAFDEENNPKLPSTTAKHPQAPRSAGQPQSSQKGQIQPAKQGFQQNQFKGKKQYQGRPYRGQPSGQQQGQKTAVQKPQAPWPAKAQTGQQQRPQTGIQQQQRQQQRSQRNQQPQRGQQQPQRGQQQPQRGQQTQRPAYRQANTAPQKQGQKLQQNNQQFSRQNNQHPNRHNQRSSFGKKISRPTVQQRKPTAILKGKVKIIPLGGLNEVGKNMTAFEYENDIIIVDMGLEFPNEDMFGIDYVIPDVSYLEDNKKRIRGVVITHGHLDHIGGIPYILPKLDFPPVFATKLTIGLIKKRIEEFKQEKMAKLNVFNADQAIRLGQFLCTFFRVAHSIPDAVGIVIDTPAGKLVHTGDFKFDDTPARNQAKADIHKMEALGHQNVLALFCESTNSLKAGHSISEQEVGKTLEKIVRESPGRVIIASFSSQVGRIQQIIDAAVANNRKIFVSGRSMSETIKISASLGYLSIPKDAMYDIKKYKKIPDKETLILTTGSQGEAVSALARIASSEHPHVKVKKGDTIVLSSSPIIGNERAISTVINNLSILGAEVIHNQIMEVHTSGHGKQDELCKMINYVKPKYLIPIHGEYYMRRELGRIAIERCGMRDDRVIMIQNGDVLLAEKGQLVQSDETVETKYILIDGLGEGSADSQVQMDREIMSQNGALVVLIYIAYKGKKLKRDPDVVSRGFTYMHETDEIMSEISKLAADSYRRIMDKNPGATRQDVKKYIRQTIDKYTHSKIERRPLIIPLLVES